MLTSKMFLRLGLTTLILQVIICNAMDGGDKTKDSDNQTEYQKTKLAEFRLPGTDRNVTVSYNSVRSNDPPSPKSSGGSMSEEEQKRILDAWRPT